MPYGLFSITALWADSLQKTKPLEVMQTAWYSKALLTFSDALAAVRKETWNVRNFYTSDQKQDAIKIRKHVFNHWQTYYAEQLKWLKSR